MVGTINFYEISHIGLLRNFSDCLLRNLSCDFLRNSYAFLRISMRLSESITRLSLPMSRFLPLATATVALTPPSPPPPLCRCAPCARRGRAGSKPTSASEVPRETLCFLGWDACRRGLPASGRWTGSIDTDWSNERDRCERTETGERGESIGLVSESRRRNPGLETLP